MQKEITHTRYFDKSPQEVWDCLTKPELIEQWLGKTDFKPVIGHKFRFTSPYGNDSFCEVLELKPFTRLSYSWQKKSLNGGKDFTSKVVWTLIPTEKGTELQLVHNGFVALEDFTGHETGWNTCLTKMEQVLNSVK